MFVSLFALQGKEKNPQKRDSIESWGVPMAAKTKEACDQGGGLWWHHRFWSQRRFTAFCWPLGWQAEERKRTPEEKGPCEPILACIPTTDNDAINLWSSNQISLLELKLPCHAPNMPISISEFWGMEAMKDGYLQAKTTAQRKDFHDYKQKRRELRERYFKNRAKGRGLSHIFCNIWQYLPHCHWSRQFQSVTRPPSHQKHLSSILFLWNLLKLAIHMLSVYGIRII